MALQFFAVTKNSIYGVCVKEGLATLLQIRGNEGLESAPMGLIVIGKTMKAVLTKRNGDLTTGCDAGQTSLIVALFLNEKDAQECRATSDLLPCDSRWMENTISTLKEIGTVNPPCHILTDDKEALIPPNKWQSS